MRRAAEAALQRILWIPRSAAAGAVGHARGGAIVGFASSRRVSLALSVAGIGVRSGHRRRERAGLSGMQSAAEEADAAPLRVLVHGAGDENELIDRFLAGRAVTQQTQLTACTD